MRTGKANIQYKTLLGYEKNSDGEMVVNAEQAETVRKIYELYLSGQTLRNIKETLETGGFKNTAERRNGQPPICGRSSLMKNIAVMSCSRRPSFETAQQAGHPKYRTAAYVSDSEPP